MSIRDPAWKSMLEANALMTGRMNLHSRGPGVTPGTVLHPRGVGNEGERRETAGERGRNHSAVYLVSLNKRKREVSANRSQPITSSHGRDVVVVVVLFWEVLNEADISPQF